MNAQRCHRILALALTLCLLCGLAAPALAEQRAVVYNPNPKDRLNLRAQASIQSASLGKYYNGAPVTVLAVQGGWARVCIGNVYGYMLAEFLLLGGREGSVPSAMPWATIRNPIPTDRLNLREGPSAQALSLAKYGNGTAVEVLGDAGDWVHVRVGGNTGYMMRDYLDGLPAQPDAPGASRSAYAVVNNPVSGQHLNLRTRPSLQGESLGKYDNGVTVLVEERLGTWYRVSVDGQTGYMQSAYLLPDEEHPDLMPADTAVVKDYGAKLTLRKAPSVSAEAAAVCMGGETLRVLHRAGTWYCVETRGIVGYAPANQVWVGSETAGNGARNLAVVNNPDIRERLNLRATASANGRVLDKLFSGVQLEVLDANWPNVGTWVRVRVAGQEGYVQSQYLDFYNRGSAASW